MIEEEIAEKAIRLLKENLDIKLISQVTGFSTEELIKLKYKTHITNSTST